SKVHLVRGIVKDVKAQKIILCDETKVPYMVQKKNVSKPSIVEAPKCYVPPEIRKTCCELLDKGCYGELMWQNAFQVLGFPKDM
ncbi:hypothetical protein S83_062380, partial [Arachis hypogaea]